MKDETAKKLEAYLRIRVPEHADRIMGAVHGAMSQLGIAIGRPNEEIAVAALASGMLEALRVADAHAPERQIALVRTYLATRRGIA